jgi:acyl-coenzyme A thioesterase PaaI-like protein
MHAATLALSINYVSASRQGRLRALGRRSGGGRNIFFAHGEVRGEDNALVATGQGTFKYRR